MWNLIIAIIAFIVICVVVNLIDKNKEKITEKLKMEKIQVMKCPRCFNEYDNLDLHFCKHCNTSLNRVTKYVLEKNLKKKIKSIILVIMLAIVIGVSAYFGINYYISEQQRIEKYNTDLQTCYTVIKNDSNWDNFNNLLKKHKEESSFEIDAYSNLYKAVNERIENLKNGNDDEPLLTMLEEIKNKTKIEKEKINSLYLKANSYSNINNANEKKQEQKYIEAFDLLGTVISSNKDKNQDIVDIATNKQNEIKEQALQQVISTAQEKMNNQEYSSAQTFLANYKNLGNQTIVDMYNSAIAQKKAKEEAEKRARIAKERFDYEVYCYFGLIAWKTDNITDDIAFSKCASKFGITKEEAKKCYETVEPRGWWYQDEYPDIFEKYASQYYN